MKGRAQQHRWLHFALQRQDKMQLTVIYMVLNVLLW